MTAPETLTDPELDQIAWDLSDLIADAGAEDPQAAVDALLDEAKQRERQPAPIRRGCGCHQCSWYG